VDTTQGPGAVEPEASAGLGTAATVIGSILLVVGGLLLVASAYPGAAWPRTAVAVAFELLAASLWAIALYVGTIVMLVTMPGLVAIGAGLLVVAARRAFRGHGVGWEVIVGAILLGLGASCVLDPPVGGPYVPIVLVAVGAGLLSRRGATDALVGEARPAVAPDR